MSHRRLLAASAVLTSILLSTSRADAGQIISINTDAKGGVNQLATVSWTFDGAAETGLAGTLITTLPSGSQVDTYCIDLKDTTYVGNGGSTWNAEVLPISAFANYPSGANWGAIGYLYAAYDATATTRIQGAALQIAIWKVEYDGNANFATGNFQFADSTDLTSDQHLVYQQATRDLAGFDGTQFDASETFFRATSHPNDLYQDLVGPGGVTANVSAVPEPASIIMAAFGIGAAIVARARRRGRA